MKVADALDQGNIVPSAVTAGDEKVLSFLRKMPVDEEKYSTEVHLLLVHFVTLCYACRADVRDTENSAGKMRIDFAKAWTLLEKDVKNMEALSDHEQYITVIVGSWLTQRLQNGTGLALLFDCTSKGLWRQRVCVCERECVCERGRERERVCLYVCVFGGSRMTFSESICFMVCVLPRHVLVYDGFSCAVFCLSPTGQLHELKTLFSTSSGHLLHTRFNDYHFLARSSLANVDLRVVCELADRFSLAMPTDGDGLARHSSSLLGLFFAPVP